MPWSKQQERAIKTRGKNILVAAAAGSGKTSVLVERVIQHIISGDCDINEILVVTFTNAAAGEMRQRIAQAIAQRLPDKEKERQLILLNAASISTLHSFCQNIIRQNFHQIELDPKFRLANPQEIDLLKLDVLDELFEAKYDSDNNGDFLEFTDTYGNERGDDSIYDIILKLYEYAQSQPFPEKWLQSLPDYFTMPENTKDCTWLQIIKDTVINQLQLAQDNLQIIRQEAAELNLDYCLKTIAKDTDLIDNLLSLAQTDFTELYTAVNEIKFSVMRAPKGTDEQLKERFKSMRDDVKKIITGLKDNYFAQPLDETLADMPQLQKQAATLCRITLDFTAAFARAKAEKTIVDFNDLEHFTLKILADKNSTADNLIPTDTARTLQHKYKEIMVDEYQDTNGVQEAILKLIASSDTPNLFFVGDVKQSIYKFRLAEPELFLAKYNTYPKRTDCERIDLAQNFRSRKEILDGVNFIFSQIMTVKASELDYGEAEALRRGFDYPENARSLRSPIEIALFAKENNNAAAANNETDDLQGFEKEATYIVNRLKQLMQDNYLVFDKQEKNYRPLKWRDIVILLRSVQDKAKILTEKLRDADIPVYASIETGYFQETEVRLMLSLLQIVDNPKQDIPLTAVLYSPIVNLTAEQLARIRLACPQGDMYSALNAAAAEKSRLKQSLKQKITHFLAKLEKWRNYARCHSVPELIWLLLDETGYYDYVGGLPEGMVRQANLRALYDRAAGYEQTSFRGLFRFLRFIQKMQNTGNDLAVARSLGESENVVRIMSIHKSKGLEFPVVILADIGKQFNLTDIQNPVLFHKKLGLGLYLNDARHHVRYQTLSRQAIAQQIIRENKAEEMRVLYVAMTRAREKLIMTGSVRDFTKFAAYCAKQTNSSDRILPEHIITNARSYLDWIGPALARHTDGLPLRNSSDNTAATLLKDSSSWQISFIDKISDLTEPAEHDQADEILNTVKKLQPLPPTDNKIWIENRLGWIYPHQEGLTIPAKLSVTEIKQRFNLGEDEYTTRYYEEFSFHRPQFIQKRTAMTATEYGSLLHTVMQHLDFYGDLSDKGILHQLENMADREIIAKEHINKIYRKNIRDFLFNSLSSNTKPVIERLRRAKSVQRELAFSRMIDAKKLLYTQANDNDTIFVQGIIDLLIEEDDGFVLLDYKTDNNPEDIVREKYAVQIKLYAQAAAEILHKPIKEKYLYLFHSGKSVEMNDC